MHPSAVDICVNNGIAHVTVPDLLPLDHRYIERFCAVWPDEAQIYGRRRLELNFQELVTNIRELPVVLVTFISKRGTYQSVKCRSSVSFLINSRISEVRANQR